MKVIIALMIIASKSPIMWVTRRPRMPFQHVMDTKLKAPQQHESKIQWVKDHHGIDFVEDARVLGLEGFRLEKYAEAFQQVKKHMQIVPVDLP